jgi:hypothetical protein
VILHLGVVEIVEQEGGDLLDDNCVVPPVEGRGCLKRNLVFDGGRREEVAPDEYELEEDLLQLLSVGVDYLVFLESFKCAKRASRSVARLVVTKVTVFFCWLALLVLDSGGAFNEVDSVSVDDAVISASDSEVIGDEDDGPFGRGCHPGLSWASKRWSATTSLVSSLVLVSSPLVPSTSSLVPVSSSPLVPISSSSPLVPVSSSSS